MSEQRERRRLVEEARAAHAAKVRRRLIVGVLAAAVLVGAAALAYAQFGGGPLQGAAEHAQERTARIRIDVEGGYPGQGSSFSGVYVTTGDNERYTAEGTLTIGGDAARAGAIRKLGERAWVRTEEGGDRRWSEVEPEEQGRAPAQVLATLGRMERVRQRGREQAAGRRTTHFEAKLPISALTGADLEGSLPVDVWIDDGGLPVLIRSETTDFRLELEVLEWDVPVEVAPPAADSAAAP